MTRSAPPPSPPPRSRPSEVDDYLIGIARAQARVVRILATRLGSRTEAEDVVQSALLRALDRAGDLRDHSKVVPWFQRILQATLVAHERRRTVDTRARSRAAGALSLGSPGDVELYLETCRCLEAALGAVKPDDARLIRQVELEGKSLRDVARALQVRTNTVAVRLHRARRAVIRVWRDICRVCRLHWQLDCACRSGGDADPLAASRRV